MAQLLEAPYSQFVDSSGVPLAGGKVYTYVSGTTTPKNSYTDASGVTPAANPVILDSAGRAAIWLDGTYTIKVTDSLGNVISPSPQDGITSASAASSISITDDTTTNATMYPIFVTANTGNLPAKVSSTKLSFNPFTGLIIQSDCTTPANAPAVDAQTIYHVIGADAANVNILIDSFGASASYIGRRAQGTAAIPTQLTLNQPMAQFGAQGFAGASTNSYVAVRADILMIATESWTNTNQGATIVWRMTLQGASSIAEVMRIGSLSGGLLVGTTSDDGVAKLQVNGHAKTTSIRGSAVAFAGLPGSPVEGMMVSVTDSNTATWGATIAGGGSNHVLAYYNGTNWTVAAK